MSALRDLDMPVFTAGGMPTLDLQTYVLEVGGLVLSSTSSQRGDGL